MARPRKYKRRTCPHCQEELRWGGFWKHVKPPCPARRPPQSNAERCREWREDRWDERLGKRPVFYRFALFDQAGDCHGIVKAKSRVEAIAGKDGLCAVGVSRQNAAQRRASKAFT